MMPLPQRSTMDTSFEQARDRFLAGVAHYEAGRLQEAEQQFAAALALAPGRPSVLTNLGAVRLKLGRPDDALDLLLQAIDQEPGNAEALGHAATALAELGRLDDAVAMFDRALAIEPRRPALWTLRGTALKERGQDAAAAASFREALARGGDAQLNGFYLAGLAGTQPPSTAPRQYVESLFDGYAGHFDTHLVQALRYDAPRRLADGLAARGRRFRSALDLGCGTGLCGPHLRALADRVTGVDLSRNMLDKAQALGIYDTLVQADVLAYLAAAREPVDLVMAADVFIYVGALDGVFREVARLLPHGGSFCFTVEEATAGELELRPSLRYAHSEGLLRRLADANGLRVGSLERGTVREEQRAPIPGLFAWLEKG